MDQLTIDSNVNISGMAQLLNTNNVKTGFDIQRLESQITNSSSQVEKEDMCKKHHDELEDIMNSFAKGSYMSKPDTFESITGGNNITGDTGGFDISDTMDVTPADRSFVRNVGRNQPSIQPQSKEEITWGVRPNYNSQSLVSDPKYINMTAEEQRQRIIQGAMDDMTTSETGVYDFDKQKEDDDKARKLETIISLREILKQDKVDLSCIPDVDITNTLSEIDSVLRMLVMKNDRKRYCTFAEDFIMLFAHGVEYAFDGKREYFGKTPNMLGWHKSVRTKLRRMRHDTSTIVSNVMREYELGALTRIGLELLPSAILYSSKKKTERADNINNSEVTEDEFDDGINTMRDNMM